MASAKRARIETEVEFSPEEDERFMEMAKAAAENSKEAIKVGACIVNENKQVVGTGYNELPRGSNSEGQKLREERKLYVVHAEVNAAINKNVKNCSLYVTLYPCNECAKMMITSQITRIVYLEDADERKKYRASREMLKNIEGSILCIKYEPPAKEAHHSD